MEVKLCNDKREKEMYEDVVELYEIIKATETDFSFQDPIFHIEGYCT